MNIKWARESAYVASGMAVVFESVTRNVFFSQSTIPVSGPTAAEPCPVVQ